MSILIDTSALVSARNADDKNHNKALDIMAKALKGEFGKLYISDYIFDEAVTIAYIRTGNKNFSNDIGIFARTKPILFRFIEPIDFERAWELYLQFQDKNFSFTDCTNIALMERNRIDTLFTYDSEFNGIVRLIG
ncbi:MAG: type II toxin-antitoxin system VapC family toxin [Candidatus Methanoperedens sp.]|nr:type II toxin-antitoxin system VapC family toxin [Candidatus Methanoperedens sp.]MCE8427737.1 type II toxin-antitoxin system VapC family toxin [Candidatus Methanoperedens sp.]